MVSQPIAGLIRLQWWREALAAIAAGRPPAHPVAQALQTTLSTAPGCRVHLEAALDACAAGLEEPPPADLEALERSAAAIVQAALVLLGASDPAALEVGRKVGAAIGLSDQLRALDSDLRHGRLTLPAAALAPHGVDPTAPLADQDLAPVIAAIAARGLERLAAARAERRSVPRAALAALLPGTLAGRQLQQLRRTGSSAALHRRSPLAPLDLLWRYARGRF